MGLAVPNHLVQQWSNSFRFLYPTAKLLIATKDDLDKDHREQFVSRVAMGDWDSVIIAQSSFAKINIYLVIVENLFPRWEVLQRFRAPGRAEETICRIVSDFPCYLRKNHV